MKRLVIASGLALVGFGAGCSHSTTSPTAPPPPVQSVPVNPPAATLRTLHGYVGDTAFRPMHGARVEVLNGPEAGKEFSSDAQGIFSYVGTFSAETSLRASSDGYVPLTVRAIVGSSLDQAWVSFALSPLTPPIEAAGNYTLTISVDSACSDFPEAARARSYSARLTERSVSTIPAKTRFDGVVSGGAFATYSNVFWVGVAGDYLAVSTEGEGPSIIERIAPKTYVTYLGSAGAKVPSGSPAAISAPFKGVIEYCELKAEIGQYYDCSDSLAAVKTQCTTGNSRLTLTPR
jgi:hypothetical protein